jgi:glycosyltransferase involved in cell wall biosynthesis
MRKDDILFVVDQLPYPPRNGITLPTYNYLIILKRQFNIKLIYLCDQNIDNDLLYKNELIFGSIIKVHIKRHTKLLRILKELCCVDMYQHGYYAQATQLDFSAYAFLVVSPMSSVAKLGNMLDLPNFPPFKIAAVNDCTTSEYIHRDHDGFDNLLNYLKAKSHFIRSYLIRKIEYKLLKKFDLILLQTERDKHLFSKYVSSKLEPRILISPNGVNPSLMTLVTDSHEAQKTVLFIAELSGEYASTATWIVTKLWPRILEKTNVKLLIVGKGASENLLSLFKSQPNITHFNFVEDILDCYRAADIVLSPVFKGFGLINKTIEGMAAGLPVVGGEAAFNGIANFKQNIHGISCSPYSVEQFSQAITYLVEKPEDAKKIGSRARSLIQEQFSWEQTVKSFTEVALCPKKYN